VVRLEQAFQRISVSGPRQFDETSVVFVSGVSDFAGAYGVAGEIRVVGRIL
jgi:hypothetical protein